MKVNGIERTVGCDGRTALSDYLRDQGLNSVHLGCEHGVCGSCNVIVDGACVRSCLMMAHSAADAEVLTLEGLQDELASRLREAFNAHHALQCGFCTPGVFVAAYELLSGEGPFDEATVRTRMAGNICRCTGYQGIINAICDVAEQRVSSAP